MSVLLAAIMGITEVLNPLEKLFKAFAALLHDATAGSNVNSSQVGADATGAAKAAVDLVHTFEGQVELAQSVLAKNHPTMPADVAHTVASQAVTTERHKREQKPAQAVNTDTPKS